MGADEPQDTTRPSLEAPKLLRRRRKKAPEDSAEPVEVTSPAPAADSRVLDDAALFADSGSADRTESVAPPAKPTRQPWQPWQPRQPRQPTERTPRPPRTPFAIPMQIAVPLVGLVTGAALIGLMWLGFRGCEAVRGTASCGTAPGLVALVVVFALTVLVGLVLLSLLKLPDPGMTSFLAVGITSLVAVLLFGALLDSAAILVVLPLLSAASFAASWWISTLQVDFDD